MSSEVSKITDLNASLIDEWLETESARLADCPVKNDQFHEDRLAGLLVLSVSAPTDGQAEKAVKLIVSLGSSLSHDAVERAKLKASRVLGLAD